MSRNQPTRFCILIIAVLMVVAGSAAHAVDVNSPYGVVAFIPSPTRWDAMLNANIEWGRCDFSWRGVEGASKGVYNWGVTDDAVALANARGLKIYAGHCGRRLCRHFVSPHLNSLGARRLHVMQPTR